MVEQNVPALFFEILLGDIVFVVDQTDCAPEIRNGVVVVRVKIHADTGGIQLVKVCDGTAVNFLQTFFLHQALNHVVGRNEHVIRITGANLGVHHFVGIKIFYNDMAIVFILEI